jgi:hypothetical protein
MRFVTIVITILHYVVTVEVVFGFRSIRREVSKNVSIIRPIQFDKEIVLICVIQHNSYNCSNV